jgi:glycogen operon protein
MAQRLQGSPDMYGRRGATASVNFVTCHDGFTLWDLVSYNGKHNNANGEDNRDGSNDNDSWNCGWEGPADDPGVNALRRRQVKNAVAMLFVSQGVPMLLMGDECGRSQGGNNNSYCHDDEVSWLDWSLRQHNAELFTFVQRCVAFRRAHPVMRKRSAVQQIVGESAAVTWHGVRAWQADWADWSRVLAFMLSGGPYRDGSMTTPFLYVALNMHWESHAFELPALPDGLRWHVFANTGAAPPEDAWPPGSEALLPDQSQILVGDRSVVILVGK